MKRPNRGPRAALTGLCVSVILLLAGCQPLSDANAPMMDAAGTAMMTRTGKPLVLVNMAPGVSRSARHFLVLIPVSVDGAQEGGSELWLGCASTIDAPALTAERCEAHGLSLLMDDQQIRFDELNWQADSRAVSSLSTLPLVASTRLPLTAEVLARFSSAAEVAAELGPAGQPVAHYRLWQDGRESWSTAAPENRLRFGARVFPNQD